MEEFKNMSLIELRKLLVDTIIDVRGKDYALGWLHSAYSYGSRFTDEDRDQLIDQIRDWRARKESTLSV
jgi:hypothetical protein